MAGRRTGTGWPMPGRIRTRRTPPGGAGRTGWSPTRPRRRSEPPTISTAQLDQDPHGTFRRYRLITPFLRREDDSSIAIRYGDVERLDPQRTTYGLRVVVVLPAEEWQHGLVATFVQQPEPLRESPVIPLPKG